MRVLRGVTVRDADDLQAVCFDFLVGEHANTGGFDGAKILGVVSKLFVIASDEIDAMRSGEAAERFSGAVGVDGGTVIQITGDKDGVRLFLEDLGDHAF